MASASSTGRPNMPPPKEEAPNPNADTRKPVLLRTRYSTRKPPDLQNSRSAEHVIQNGHCCEQEASKNPGIGYPLYFLAEDHCQGVLPGESFNFLWGRGWSEKTHNDKQNAAHAEHPPGLHHERDAEPASNDLFRAKYWEI